MSFMGIESHVVILRTKLHNQCESNEKPFLSNVINQATRELEKIYPFLLKDECQTSDKYKNWKERLGIAMDRIEGELETSLYNVESFPQTKIIRRLVPVSWVVFKNNVCLYRAMKRFLATTNELSKDQSLAERNSLGDYRCLLVGNTPQKAVVEEGLEGKMERLRDELLKVTKAEKEPLKETKAEKEELSLRDQTTTSRPPEYYYFGISVVWGPAGAGKTALTRAVTTSAGIQGRFQCHVWIQMGKETNFRQLLLRLLNQVTHSVPMNPEDMEINELTTLVIQQLLRKSVLIVLEDAEHSDVIGELFEVLLLIESRVRTYVIVTTHVGNFIVLMPEAFEERELLELKMGLLELKREAFEERELLELKMEPLPEKIIERKQSESETSRDSFTKIIKDREGLSATDPLPEKDEKIVESMIKSCQGLPLKISLLKKLLLHTSDVKVWPQFVDKEGKIIELDVYRVCYNKLPPHLKPCFLYLCLFPKSFPIPIRRILRLWIAEDLIQLTHKEQQPEEIAEMYLYEMVHRNLVEVVKWKSDGSPHAFHMNANLYDVFLPSARNIGLVEDIYDLKNTQDRHVRWLVEPEYVGKQKLPDLSSNVGSGCPFSFVSFRKRKGILTNDLSGFIKNLTSRGNPSLLRVLDLEGVYKPNLDKSLKQLFLLRYLGLRSTGLDSLPRHVGALPYLETLDVKHTNISELPSSIWMVSRMRHLDLNGFHFNQNQLRRFSRAAFISKLRTLSGFHVACSIDHDVHHDLCGLKQLVKLGVTFNNPDDKQMEKITQWIEKLTTLISLKLEILASDKTNPDDDKTAAGKEMLPNLSRHEGLARVYLLGKLQTLNATKLPQSMRVLTLSMSNLAKDPMRSLGDPSTRFTNLIELRLLADCYTGEQMTFPCFSFPNLKVLKLWKLELLVKIVIEKKSLQNLEHLEIRHCPKLTTIELPQDLKPALKELIVFGEKKTELVKHLKAEITDLYVREGNPSTWAVDVMNGQETPN